MLTNSLARSNHPEADILVRLIERITPPTVVLWGDEDPMTTLDLGKEYVEQLPDATIQLISHAGHAPWVDQPQIVADAIRSHFN